MRGSPLLTENSTRACASRGDRLGYLIAAYGLVIVTLALYGLRVQAQRRARLRPLPVSADADARER